jgi:hypothetical protein
MAIASTLYGFNWHTFYDTQRNFARSEAQRTSEDIESMLRALGRLDEDDAILRGAVRGYVERRRAHIVVTRLIGEREAWRESNHSAVDTSRTLFARDFSLESGRRSERSLRVEIREGIRPRLVTALARAWTFSILDYRADSERWWGEHLYNRSMPLYGYLLTITLVGFGTIRALHHDQLRLAQLNREADNVRGELGELRSRSASEIERLKDQATRTEAQRGEAVRERERLISEIEAVEQEYGAPHEGGQKVGVSDARLRQIRDRKAEIERELTSHDEKVDGYESELTSLRSELSAAEDLLSEVESKQGDLDGKLRDRNRQIRNLQYLVDQAQQDTHAMQLDSLRLAGEGTRRRGPTEDESGAGPLESQLVDWIDPGGPIKTNFSQHSRSVLVEEAYARMDRDFVDFFFTHANNAEYERGQRKLIRVQANDEHQREGDERRSGELVIALDDDTGRTLALRFEVRKSAPSVSHIGFVLALLCREHCREFSSFAIKIR